MRRVAILLLASFAFGLEVSPLRAEEAATLRETMDRAARLFEAEDFEGARRAYRLATEIDPGALDAWNGLGWCHWQLGEKERAVRVWKDALGAKPSHPALLQSMAHVHEERGDVAKALALYGKALETEPDSYAARMGRARLLIGLERHAEAGVEARRALEGRPTDFDAQLLLVEAYRSTGRRAEAKRVLERLSRQEANPKHYRAMGDVMLEMNRPDEALSYFEKNLRLHPGNRGTILGIARAHAQRHEYDRAVERLERFLASHPEDDKIREEMSRFASQGGDYDTARRHLEALVERDPEKVAWHVSLAEVHQESGNHAAAASAARKAIALDPRNVEAYDLLIDDAFVAGKPNEAIEWLERLIEVEPSVARLNQLGDLYLALGDRLKVEGHDGRSRQAFARSAEAFALAARQPEPSADAELGVATALRLKEDYESAIQAASGVIEQYPSVERGRRELYESYAGLGEFETSREYLLAIMKQFPNNLRHEHAYARLLFKEGRRDEAIAYLQGLLEEPLAPGVPVLLYHGVSQASTGHDSMSIDRFREQMRALREAGFESITVHDLVAFLERGAALPKRPVFITFDDARADSFRNADPVLEAVGFEATMFVPVADVGAHGPFSALWSTLREKVATGRWDLQCHSRIGHRPIPIDADGHTGPFLANRQWLDEEERLETREEFIRRLDEDYALCKEELERRVPGIRSIAYAYPFGELGQKTFSNEPKAVEINKELVLRHYQVAFAQDPAAVVSPRSPRAVLPRFEVPWDMGARELLAHLEAIDPEVSTLLALTDLYAWDGQFAEAERIFESLESREDVDQTELVARRGRIRMWQGDFAGARRHLQVANAARPEDRDVKKGLSRLDRLTSPKASADALYYEDNSGRVNVSAGPSGSVHLSDRFSLLAEYRYRRLEDDAVPIGERALRAADSPASADLEVSGNEVEAGVEWQRDWQTGIILKGGLADFRERARMDGLSGPEPFPLATALVQFELGDRTHVSVVGRRDYVAAAGAILDDLGTSQGEGRLRLHPFDGVEADGRFLFNAYDDGNRRSTAIGKITRVIWDAPDVRLGYRLTYDDTRDANPFFYSPDGFLGNEGVVEVGLEPFDVLDLSIEGGFGLGQERQSDAVFQASVMGEGRLDVADRMGLYATGGRSQAASFDAFQITGGLYLYF